MTDEEFNEGMKLAFSLVYNQEAMVGRKLHPAERRWLIRAGFRFYYKNNSEADELAGSIIEVIEASLRNFSSSESQLSYTLCTDEKAW